MKNTNKNNNKVHNRSSDATVLEREVSDLSALLVVTTLPSIPLEVTQCSLAFLHIFVLFEVIAVSFRNEFYSCFASSIAFVLFNTPGLTLIKLMKWFSASYVMHLLHVRGAVTENEELPPPFSCSFPLYCPFGRKCGRAIRNWALGLPDKPDTRCSDHDFFEVVSSLMQAKKGLVRPSIEFVDNAVIETYTLLTTRWPRQSDEGTPPSLSVAGDPQLMRRFYEDQELCESRFLASDVSLFIDRASIRYECERVVDEIFKGCDKFSSSEFLSIFPSTSANYIRSRSLMGSVPSVKAVIDALLSEIDTITPTSIEAPQLYDSDDESESSRYATPLGVSSALDFTEVDRINEVAVRHLMRLAILEPSTVTLVGLSEPLKARVISKGPPIKNYLFKAVQKHIFNVLTAFDRTSRLVGTVRHESVSPFLIDRPVTAEVLTARIGRLTAGEIYVSADYSDATNRIDPYVTEVIWNRICHHILPDYADTPFAAIRALGLELLTRHDVTSPSGVESRPQCSGQLMGSILSFPILCLANMVIVQWSMSAAKRQRIALRTQRNLVPGIRALINGDDAVFATTPSGFRIWMNIAACFGMSASPGKVFVSSQFCNMNSTNFLSVSPSYEPGQRTLSFAQTSYVSLGLLYGKGRSSLAGNSELPRLGINGLGARASELISFAPSHLASTLISSFLRLNARSLSRTPLPFNLSEANGGIGIPLWRTCEGDIPTNLVEAEKFCSSSLVNLSDRLALAWLFRERRNRARTITRVSQFSINFQTCRNQSIWQVDRAVRSLLLDSGVSVVNSENPASQVEYDRLYGRLAFFALLRFPLSGERGLANLIDEPAGREQRVLRHNIKLWSTARGRTRGYLVDNDSYKRAFKDGLIPVSDEQLMRPPSYDLAISTSSGLPVTAPLSRQPDSFWHDDWAPVDSVLTTLMNSKSIEQGGTHLLDQFRTGQRSIEVLPGADASPETFSALHTLQFVVRERDHLRDIGIRAVTFGDGLRLDRRLTVAPPLFGDSIKTFEDEDLLGS